MILSRELLDTQLKILGPLNIREQAAILGIVVFALGIVTTTLHRIQPPWIALTLLYALLLSGVLPAREFRQKIDWPFLIFLGGIVGMVNSLNYLALDQWLATNLSWMGSYMRDSFSIFVIMLTMAMFIIRIVVPISATIVIIATVLIPVAVVAGINPWLIGFIILLMGENWFLPYQCSYYIQFRNIIKSQQLYDEKVFLMFNATSIFIKLIAIYASIPFWKYLGIL